MREIQNSKWEYQGVNKKSLKKTVVDWDSRVFIY
ncbi:MAG: hypothetical protein CM15mP44_6340 [Candidatus Neomarinimicrobiota bacterium]|nr:MAG: hypothetical protein CM15mP44_6340 [Candidatus Neomarinimicrobiota bacterium]